MKLYKRGQLFFCIDCGDIADGFPMKEWVVIVKEYHSTEVADRDFNKQWNIAREERRKKLKRLADIEVLPSWQESQVDRSSICGVRVSAHFKFMDSESHHSKFKVYPLSSRVFPLLLEHGITVADGVFIRPAGSPEEAEPFETMRDVEVFRQFHHSLEEHVLAAGRAIRALEHRANGPVAFPGTAISDN